MNIKVVEAVWIWRYGTTAFKATYGRLPDNTYTKDYLQASGECLEAFEIVFPKSLGRPLALTLTWPAGTKTGTLFEPTDYPTRLNLKWPTSDAPTPWRLLPNPGPSTDQTIPGDPNKETPDEANDELRYLRGLNLDPYLIAVKLYGEHDVLHVRAYLNVPSAKLPPNLQHASTENLPSKLRTAISEMNRNQACTALLLGSRAPKITGAIFRSMRYSPSILLIGPPGCGKSVALEDLRSIFEYAAPNLLFDTSKLHDCWPATSTVPAPPHRARTVVFHPSYAYEEFVLGLYPSPGVGGSMQIILRPGPLLSLSHWASTGANRSLLIIDEFNRGNPASIFGDTLALLDMDQRSDPGGRPGAVVDRSHASLPLNVSQDFATSKGTNVGSQLSLPKTLSIVAAMNSSDRSVAPLDAALRRRFTVIRVEPDYRLLAERLGVQLSDPITQKDIVSVSSTEILRLGIAVLMAVNQRIEHILGADFVIGHSVFWHITGSSVHETLASLCAALDNGVINSLRITLSDQDEALAATLNCPRLSTEVDVSDGESYLTLGYWIQPGEGLADVAMPRLRIRSTSEMEPSVALDVLRSILSA